MAGPGGAGGCAQARAQGAWYLCIPQGCHDTPQACSWPQCARSCTLPPGRSQEATPAPAIPSACLTHIAHTSAVVTLHHPIAASQHSYIGLNTQFSPSSQPLIPSSSHFLIHPSAYPPIHPGPQRRLGACSSRHLPGTAAVPPVQRPAGRAQHRTARRTRRRQRPAPPRPHDPPPGPPRLGQDHADACPGWAAAATCPGRPQLQPYEQGRHGGGRQPDVQRARTAAGLCRTAQRVVRVAARPAHRGDDGGGDADVRGEVPGAGPQQA